MQIIFSAKRIKFFKVGFKVEVCVFSGRGRFGAIGLSGKKARSA